MRTSPPVRTGPRHQRGAALLIVLTIIGLGAAFLLVSALNKAGSQNDRNNLTTSALAQAKDALIGSAAMYGDSPGHIGDVNGYLPLPDLGSSRNTTPGEGATAGNFTGNAAELSVLGRLPWRALGLPPLRDGNGECLWYAVSGAYQEIIQTRFMNWDTLGQLDTYTSDGTPGGTVSTSGTSFHQRPAAVIFAPGALAAGQSRALSATDTVAECSGNYGAINYLDTVAPNPLVSGIVNYFTGTNNATGTYLFATPKPLIIGPVSDASGNLLVSDKVLIITPDDIFRAIKRRSDFGTFVAGMLTTATSRLSTAPPAPATIDFSANPPTSTSGGTIVGSLEIGRIPDSACLNNLPLQRWQDNLLYAKCTSGGSCLTVNGASCKGVVIFAGERSAATTPIQVRGSNAQRNTWSNYLEGTVLSAFTSGGTSFAGAAAYDRDFPSRDVLACITDPPPGQVTFASNLGSFVAAGSGVSTSIPTQSIAVVAATGSSGGCLWYPTTIPLSGKTLRAYYTFTFMGSDPSGGTDLGNGFTLSLLRGDVGPPTACGTQSYMGALDASTLWGNMSYVVETDVHQDSAAANDPAGNHTAIMANGNLTHSTLAGGNGYTTTACNGSAQGCLHSPANAFEESPAPLNHNQRIEIHTGCDSTCTTCNSSGAYARIKVWTDCASCIDTTSDFASTPTASRCIALDASMSSVYFGFTGGFSSTGGGQGVTIRNLDLRAQ